MVQSDNERKLGYRMGLNSTISVITTTLGYSSGVVGMVNVILIVFAAMIVFMMLKSMMEGA
jgi:hypothetical protein